MMRLIVSIDWFEPGNSIRVPGETTHPHLNHINSENSENVGMKQRFVAGDEFFSHRQEVGNNFGSDCCRRKGT